MDMLQRPVVRTDLYTTWRVTRFTESQFLGSQRSTDVCHTTPVWQSLMMTFSPTSPHLCSQNQDHSGSDWSNPGGPGRMLVLFSFYF